MSHQKPIVSIILPTYNRADLLPAAIESVLNQTYSNWELIIWNDGSTDATKSILKKYSDLRIRCLEDVNHGKSWALNRGIEVSSADYIAFLDDDDQWTPQKLQLQVKAMENHPDVEMLFGNYDNLNLSTGRRGQGFQQNRAGLSQLKVVRSQTDKLNLIQDGFLKGIARENFIAFDTVLIRKNTIEKLGNFNEHLRNGMDFEYWWRLGLAGCSVAYMDEVILTRVKYPDSLSGQSLVSLQNFLKVLQGCEVYAEKLGQPQSKAYLKPRYRNTWQNLITAYAEQRDLRNMTKSFLTTFKYGFSLGSFRLFLQGILKYVIRNLYDH